MPFKKMERPNLPPRHWVLVGYPGSGKSTFATQMRTPLLPVDADHRFGEVVHLAQGDVYELSNNPADSVDPETIYRLLNQNMPGSDVATVVVDSLTTIITPKVVQAVIDNDAGRSRNRMAAFKDKALSMRLLQDAVTMWGTDVLWIYHLQDSRDEQAREVTRATLSATERARLYRSINLELHVIQERNRRGIKVVWARRGRSGMTLWDDTGKWVGMPEKIEQAVYAGLSVTEQDKIEQETPAVFSTEEAAIEWAQGQGIFKDFNHTRNSFNKLKKANPNLSLAELSVLWVEEVEAREAKAREESKGAEEQGSRGENGNAPASLPPVSTGESTEELKGVELGSKEIEQNEIQNPKSSAKPPGGEIQNDDDEPLEERFDFTLFCDNVMAQVPFYQSVSEVAATLAALGLAYDPEQEDQLLEALRTHAESLPTFESLKDLLLQLHEEFQLEDAEAKAKLKALGFTGFPRSDGAREKSRQMYAAVKMAMLNKPTQEPDEVPI
jgi:hypothetical protein